MREEIMFSLVRNGTFAITLANSCTQKPPYVHFRRKPVEFILYYIYEGEFFLKDGKEEYHITPNDILILDPSREHYGLKSSECKFAYVHFLSDSLHETTGVDLPEGSEATGISIPENSKTTDVSVPKYIHISSLNNELIIKEQLASLISIFNTKSIFYEEMASNLLANILLCIASEYQNANETQNLAKMKSFEISKKLIKLINENYSKNINSDSIEKALGYNFDYLNRCMKKHTNYTIIHYLNMVRIEKSKELILAGIYTFEDIALNIGFSDIYYFNKVFKKYAGVTPGKYKSYQPQL